MRVEILGILNLTRDSFSDGGRYFDRGAAVAHALEMVADGADIIDVGAESTHPDAEDVPADEELARLTPVIRELRRQEIRVSVDTHKPAVIRAVLEMGVEIINDVTALRDPDAVAALRDARARIILMHSTARGARAERGQSSPGSIVSRMLTFFERRVAELPDAGIDGRRLILDPGMGLFLGSDADSSLAVLANLRRLVALGPPVCVCTSRKSFIGSMLGQPGRPRPVDARGSGTLASELWAAQAGVRYIRTHDVRALRDALTVWQGIVRQE